MSTYAERAEETSFTSLIEDDEFKADLDKDKITGEGINTLERFT